MPVTIPEDASMVALLVLLLLHVPSATAFSRVVVAPGQTLAVPVITGTDGLIVITLVVIQPEEPSL